VAAKANRPTWAGRLPGGLASEAWDFLHSLPHDRFLWPYDVDGTRAHVSALAAAGVLTKSESTKLRRELAAVRVHPELMDEADEDVHSAIERVLTDRLGDLGAKVHAGRSRNDQVATALRLWAREQIGLVRDAVAGLVEALATRAEEHAATVMPGYTHVQRAQPVTLGHWLCAHAWSFVRDLERLGRAYASADVSPLGAGALATSTLGIDPKVAAAELGFAKTFDNSMDAVSDRDFLLDAAYACSVALTHLSRLAEEIVLWSSAEFGFVELPDAYATGSSMMPQKKNPDVAELARGTTGVAVGALAGLLVMMKSLPLAYDRDLQTDKQHVRGLFSATTGAFASMTGLLRHAVFETGRLADAASDARLMATDAAESMVREGVPFRKAHERVGNLVAEGRAHEAAEPTPDEAVKRRDGPGGPSPRSVRRQVRRLRSGLR
jgi:argininosuccinate lyase